LVIEDCAQAFGGTEYQGHPDADASMFSFGVIKAGTALGGAVLRIRDGGLLRRMRATQAAYPVESRWRYLKRLAKAAALKALGYGPLCSFFVYVCRTIGWDYDQWVNRAARGFPGDGLFAQLRRQPSASLLAVLHRRLRNHDPCRAERHAAKGRALASALRESVTCPGATVVPHTYWVFPVLVEEPKRLIERLARAGYDTTQGQSLCVVHAPKDRPGQSPVVAEGILAKAVFLPFYPELPHRESQRMAEVVLGSAVDS
jgi:dTDP-4-amino-4,6-dideoxygalactose transaminase